MMDFVTSKFPNHTLIVIGLAFLAIVYLIPNGVTGLIEEARTRMKGTAEKVGREKEA
jgi:branched-chain amino acid transport system permease protein